LRHARKRRADTAAPPSVSVGGDDGGAVYSARYLGGADPPGFSPANGLVTPPGINVNGTNTCNASGLLDDLTNCATQIAPDIIEKLAVAPGWGHYEALALRRWFSDATNNGLPGTSWSHTFGWGSTTIAGANTGLRPNVSTVFSLRYYPFN
jgi:hypothetical protein